MACGSLLNKTRFAPSPSGALHLGHAFAAIIAFERADPGQFVLRIEDLDQARCKPAFEAGIFDDLAWLGLRWQEPVWRQSARKSAYDAAISDLAARGLCYPCRCSRADIKAALSAPQEGARGPDGPPYPGTCRHRNMAEATPQDTVRLNMAAAIAHVGAVEGLRFEETGRRHFATHSVSEDFLLSICSDIALSRKDMGAAYHLAVVIDDAAQGITEVTRGEDLFAATQIHRLLQALLGLPTPKYHHHALVRDEAGKRLAKRDDARSLAHYRAAGATPGDIRRMLGL